MPPGAPAFFGVTSVTHRGLSSPARESKAREKRRKAASFLARKIERARHVQQSSTQAQAPGLSLSLSVFRRLLAASLFSSSFILLPASRFFN